MCEERCSPLSASHGRELLRLLLSIRQILNNPSVGPLLDELSRTVPSPGEQLLDERDAAKSLGIPAKTLGNLRRNGELPAATYVQRGKRCHVLYVRDALLLYFKINPHR